MPRWKQRLLAPQIKAFSLLGPPVSWAQDRDRGVLLANTSGRFEVYAFDASSRPAQLRQVTDRPQGTVGCAIAPDGSEVFWFDDQDGDELGRWRRQPFAGGEEVVLLADLPEAYGSGIVTRRGGGAVVGRGVDDGFELAVVSADGRGEIVYRSAEHARLLDADEDVAAISHPPDGDLFHPIVRVVDLSDGRIVAELDDQGRGVTPIAFSPARDRRLLVVHSRHDRKGLLIWSPATGEVEEVVVDLDGDVDRAVAARRQRAAARLVARWSRRVVPTRPGNGFVGSSGFASRCRRRVLAPDRWHGPRARRILCRAASDRRDR